MASLAGRMERECREGTSGKAVRLLQEGSRELGRMFKEVVLQGVIDKSVTAYLGMRRGASGRSEVSPWSCSACGPRLGSELKRNGHYLRRPLVSEGMITLRIPQLLCRDCSRSVPFTHPLLPRRKRLWLDFDQDLAALYLEGCSYRACRRLLERKTGSSVGLMTLWRAFQDAGKGAKASPQRPPARYLGLDEVYHKVKGKPRWVLAVRAQDEHGGKHWVGSVLSSDRSQEAWETALVELGISRYNPPFAVLCDGDQAIESAVLTTLPGVRICRCTWHVKHNAWDWIHEHYPRPEDAGRRKGLMAAVHVIVDAPDLDQRKASLAILGEDFAWLVRRLRRGLERVPPADSSHPVRTNNLLERGFRELRRRTRPMDGFGSDEGAGNFLFLWMLKENARTNGRDFLAEIFP